MSKSKPPKQNCINDDFGKIHPKTAFSLLESNVYLSIPGFSWEAKYHKLKKSNAITTNEEQQCYMHYKIKGQLNLKFNNI